MSQSSNELLGLVIFGLFLFLLIGVGALVGLSNLTGLPFLDLVSNARVLLIGPILLVVVLVIERMEVPLPFRLENTWPVIAAVFWIGIYRLIVMIAEKDGPSGILGYDAGYSTPWTELPWYAESWFFWVVFVLIIGAGYAIRRRFSFYKLI
jgi:hypothetical protein